jgi:hypothetical protein
MPARRGNAGMAVALPRRNDARYFFYASVRVRLAAGGTFGTMTNVDSPATNEGQAPGEGVAPADAVTSLDRRERLWLWLEVVGKRLGLPSLVVGLVSLCVGSAALYFVVKNYQMAVASNRPELASNGFHIQLASQPPLVAVDLENVGKKIARRGEATLYALAELDGPLRKIRDAPIIGAGTNVFAGYGSSARFDSTSIAASAFFLVCVSYFDDAGVRYSQAMMFERSPKTARDPAELAYAELATPDLDRCNAKP